MSSIETGSGEKASNMTGHPAQATSLSGGQVAWRLITAIVALVTLSAAALILAPLPPLHPTPTAAPLDDLARQLLDSSRKRSVEVSLADTGTVIEYSLDIVEEPESTDQKSRLTDFIRRGNGVQDTAAFAFAAIGWASVGVNTGRDALSEAEDIPAPVPMTWRLAQFEELNPGLRVVLVASNKDPSPDPAAVRVSPASLCAEATKQSQEEDEACATAFLLRTDGYRLFQVYAESPSGVTDMGNGKFRGDVVSPVRLEVGTREPVNDSIGPTGHVWLEEVWRHAVIFAPWLLLLWVVSTRRSLERTTGALDREARVLGLFLWAGLITVFVVSQQVLSTGGVGRGSLAAVPAALFAWASWADRSRTLGFRQVMLALQIAAVIGALLALVIVVPGAGNPLRALAGGLLAVAGGVALAWSFAATGTLGVPSEGWSSHARFLTGAATAAVVVLVSISQDSNSYLDWWVSSAVTVLCVVLFLTMLAWAVFNVLAGFGTRGPPGGYSGMRGRVRHVGPRLLTVAVLAVVVLPRMLTVGVTNVPQSAVAGVAGATAVLLQLGLIVTAAALLWRIAAVTTAQPGADSSQVRPCWRDLLWLAGAVGACFLLRGDVVYLLPWSLLVGGALIWGLLLERSPSKERTRKGLGLVPLDTAKTEIVAKTAIKAETLRRRTEAIRKRMGQAEHVGDGRDAEAALHATWEYAQSRSIKPPGPEQKHAAVGWSGSPSATDRAVRAMAVSLALGIPLSIPVLGGALSELTDVRGVDTWARVLTAFVLLVRFPLYGFFFGYFLPVLRGSTGLAKAGRLLVVLAVSEAAALLLPFQSTSEFIEAFVLRALQLAVVCLALGLSADLWALRRIRLGLPALLDIYSVRAFTFSASTAALGVATAAATAAATTALTSAADAYLERILSEPAAVEVVSEPDQIKTTTEGE